MRSKGDEKKMKRVKGGRKVIKGQISMNTHSNRIMLFDGKFTTGYRVVEFRIIPKSPQNQEEVIAVLSTEAQGGVPSTLNFSNNTQIAFSLWNTPNQTESSTWDLVVSDNMAVEDLFLSNYTTGDDTDLNFYIELEKYEFTAWDGAGTMVANQSQSVSGAP